MELSAFQKKRYELDLETNARLELSMLMVKLLAKSSNALANVLLRHIHPGFVNKLLDILENFACVSIA